MVVVQQPANGLLNYAFITVATRNRISFDHNNTDNNNKDNDDNDNTNDGGRCTISYLTPV